MHIRINRFWEIEEKLKPWLMTCREQGIPVDNEMIKGRAIAVAERLGMRGGGHPHQFVGGRPWLKTFKERFGITDGVATRLGFTTTNLAREKAYGRFPLDQPLLSQLPDEEGNVADPWDIHFSEYDDMDFERKGHFIIFKPRAALESSSFGDCDSSSSTSSIAASTHQPCTVDDTDSTGGSDMTSSQPSPAVYPVACSSNHLSTQAAEHSSSAASDVSLPQLGGGSVGGFSLHGPSALTLAPVDVDTGLDQLSDSSRSAPSMHPYPSALLSFGSVPFDTNITASAMVSASGVPGPLPVELNLLDASIIPYPMLMSLATSISTPLTQCSPDLSAVSSSNFNSPTTPSSIPVSYYTSCDRPTPGWALGTVGDVPLQLDQLQKHPCYEISPYHAFEKSVVHNSFPQPMSQTNHWSAQNHAFAQASEPPTGTTHDSYMGSHITGTALPWMMWCANSMIDVSTKIDSSPTSVDELHLAMQISVC